MKQKIIKKKFLNIFSSYLIFSLFIFLFIIQIITRFSFQDSKSDFGWDQVDNAWAAKNIIIDHKFPLIGMQAKGNTGFYIGPYYYYLITPFYLASNLDPSASVMIAGFTSLLTGLLVFFIIKDIFNEKVALIALFIDVFSVYIIILDRFQWPVNFIAPISLLIVYSLYKIVKGNSRYLILLSFALGFSMHIHFTSIFYLPLILLSLPFFPRNKQMIINLLYSLPIIIFFMFPLILSYLNQYEQTKSVSYLSSSFHGLHLRRIIQVAKDGFIEFEGIISFKIAKNLGYILLPFFAILLVQKKFNKENLFLGYVSVIWIIVPWVAFSTYSGEISNYYFSMTRPIVLILLSYLLYRVISLKKYISYALVGLLMFYYAYTNIVAFSQLKSLGLSRYRKSVIEKIKKGEKINFTQGDPESYLYYLYKERYEK